MINHNFIDLTGQQFGLLKVVSRAENNKKLRAMWNCLCACGNETTVDGKSLRNGNTNSCGCYGKTKAIKHGKSISPERYSFKSMHGRCKHKSLVEWKHYGGRGIKVCERWSGKEGFANFLKDMGERPEGTSLDRVDFNGNYEPSNCRWATRSQQKENQRCSLVTYDKLCLEIVGLKDKVAKLETQNEIWEAVIAGYRRSINKDSIV